jgi:hypothetical protein
MGPRNFNLAYLDLGFCSVEDLFFTKKISAAGTTRGGTHKLESHCKVENHLHYSATCNNTAHRKSKG